MLYKDVLALKCDRCGIAVTGVVEGSDDNLAAMAAAYKAGWKRMPGKAEGTTIDLCHPCTLGLISEAART